MITGSFFLLPALDGIFFHFWISQEDGSMLRAAMTVLLIIGLVAVFQGLVQLLRPQIFLEATDRGLVLPRQPGPEFRNIPDRFLVPWVRIRSLDYEVHMLPTGIRRSRTETIAIRLTEGVGVPTGYSHLLQELPSQDPEAVYIDAGTGEPGGRLLLTGLEELRRTHGASKIVDARTL